MKIIIHRNGKQKGCCKTEIKSDSGKTAILMDSEEELLKKSKNNKKII